MAKLNPETSLLHLPLKHKTLRFSDTFDERVGTALDNFDYLVQAISCRYDRVIVPPVVGTDSGDIRPLLGLTLRLATQLPKQQFEILALHDYQNSFTGYRFPTNVTIVPLDTPSQPLSVIQRLAVVTKPGQVGNTQVIKAYNGKFKFDGEPQAASLNQRVSQAVDRYLGKFFPADQAARTLFLTAQNSYTFTPIVGTHIQPISHLINYLPEDGIISELMGEVTWANRWDAAMQRFIIQDLVMDKLLWPAKLKNSGSHRRFTAQAYPLLLTMSQFMVPQVDLKGAPTRTDRRVIGQIRPVDIKPEETQQALEKVKQLKKLGHRVALFSSSASSLNGNYSHLEQVVTTFQKLSQETKQPWTILVPTNPQIRPELEKWIADRDLHNNVELIGYVHHTDIMPKVDVFMGSGGVGTAQEALRASVPTLLFAMPLMHEQRSQATKAAQASNLVKFFGWYEDITKQPEVFYQQIAELAKLNPTKGHDLAQRMARETELLSPELQLALMALNQLSHHA